MQKVEYLMKFRNGRGFDYLAVFVDGQFDQITRDEFLAYKRKGVAVREG